MAFGDGVSTLGSHCSRAVSTVAKLKAPTQTTAPRAKPLACAAKSYSCQYQQIHDGSRMSDAGF
jgi:hypothetical protein